MKVEVLIMNAIAIEKYTKIIKRRQVLNIEHLCLEKGQMHGFCGINGSGKTMLFRAVAGLINATSGNIKIYDRIIGKDISFPAHLGIMLENVGFWPQLTGFENLEYLSKIRNEITKEDILRTVNRIGLKSDDVFKKYGTYSLGMKQKLGIAQAVMERPDILILDEPTNSLDEESVDLLRKVLLAEKERGATILVSSHHKDDLLFCDYRYKMTDGACLLME